MLTAPRSPILAATAFVAVALAAGCTAPTPDPDAALDQARDVRLVEPETPAAVQVSDLEAGRPVTAPRAARSPTPSAPTAPATPDVVAALGLDQAPALGATSAEPMGLREAPMPAARPAEEPVVLVGRGVEPMYEGYGGGIGSSHGGSGPGIIIRGGRGGVDDDCDLHRPGTRIAINRIAPSPAGGVSIIGRSNAGPRFRGGIR